MTVFRNSSYAIRRIAIGNKISKRMYSHLTQPLSRATAQNESTSSTESKTMGWLVPAAIALFGLGFSTFSTHQLMSCNDSGVVIGKK